MSFPPLTWFRDTLQLEALEGHGVDGEVYADPVTVACSVDRDAPARAMPDGSTVQTTAVILVPLVQPDGGDSPTPPEQSKVTLADGTAAYIDNVATETGPWGPIVHRWKAI